MTPWIPPCEACGREPATSFSWFADASRSESGTWKFTGDCTADTETYYVMLYHRRGTGYLDSQREQEDWERHLAGKAWFDRMDFAAALARFEAAGGTLTPRRKK